MAKLYKGLLDGFSGKIGDIVGRKLKNKFIMTKLNSNPKKSKSDRQKQIESAMALCRGLAGFTYNQVLRELIDIGSKKTNVIAQFVETNFDHFKTFPIIFYDLIIFSSGTILTTQIKNITISASNERVRITWNKNWDTGSIEENDKVFAIVINESSGEINFSAASKIRKDKIVDVTFLNIIGADIVHVYLCFNRNSNKLTSGTSYMRKN